MNNTFSLSPLFRQTEGFDRLNDILESLIDEDSGSSYPPYNIEKYGEDNYAITMAVAGFNDKDINIVLQSDKLTVTGRIQDKEKDNEVEFLYRGIVARAFERTFRLADHMKVSGAEMKDGLLRIQLKREVPEEEKPRMIQINSSDRPKAIEHSNKDKKKIA